MIVNTAAIAILLMLSALFVVGVLMIGVLRHTPGWRRRSGGQPYTGVERRIAGSTTTNIGGAGDGGTGGAAFGDGDGGTGGDGGDAAAPGGKGGKAYGTGDNGKPGQDAKPAIRKGVRKRGVKIEDSSKGT